MQACGGEPLLRPVEEKLRSAESYRFCHFPPRKVPLSCPPSWCVLRLRGRVGMEASSTWGQAAIRFRGEKLPKGREGCRRRAWLQEFLCCGLPGAGGSSGESHTTLLAFLCFPLKCLLWAAASSSVPRWMPTGLVKGSRSCALLSAGFWISFTTLLLPLRLFPCKDDFSSLLFCSSLLVPYRICCSVQPGLGSG